MMKRRNFMLAGAALAASGAALRATPLRATTGRRLQQWEPTYSGGSPDVTPLPPGRPGKDYNPVVVPDGGKVPFRIVRGVKVFHLIVSEVEHEFTPGLCATCWGYNGRVNSTVFEAVEGERVRIYVTNKLEVPTTVHWHGFYLPNGMDGVSAITQRAIPPGDTFKYEWTLRQFGTFMYHSHHDTMTQEGMGLAGMFVVHPRQLTDDLRVDRDFALMLNEYRIDPGTHRPNPNEMTDFNVLTINGRALPGTTPLVVKKDQRVRIRIGKLSPMDHHPIHLHGYRFRVTATDGERIPLSAQWPETTVLMGVGQTRDIEFVADAPGDWIMHCHMTHHIMNQMGHGLPNMIGVKPGELDDKIRPLLPSYMTMGTGGMGEMAYMRMPVVDNSVPMSPVQLQYGKSTVGGMFTIVKVREHLTSYDDPGWYRHPPGTLAEKASADELRRDGVFDST
jgi:FtsP/CotA-like multicopper oxidase with cupredoxin domain